MGFVIPRFCYIGSAAIKGFNILGFRDIGFITPGVRYTGVRSTGILLDTGVPSVPYAGISLCKVHYQYQDFHTGARYTRISLYIEVRYTRISLYIVVRCTGISPYRASFNRNLVL